MGYEKFLESPLLAVTKVSKVHGSGTDTIIATIIQCHGLLRLNDLIIFPDGKKGVVCDFDDNRIHEKVAIKSVNNSPLTLSRNDTLVLSDEKYTGEVDRCYFKPVSEEKRIEIKNKRISFYNRKFKNKSTQGRKYGSREYKKFLKRIEKQQFLRTFQIIKPA